VILVQPFAKLGRFDNDWLQARYHFSFANYHDHNRMGVGSLRVWNDDCVTAGHGFDPHPHRDMEVITYVRSGAITHRDSLGNEGRTQAGDIQVMHAGTGIMHAEYNLDNEPVRLFQIWIMPNRRGVPPGWGVKRFPGSGDGLAVLASGRAEHADADVLPLYADAALFAGTLPKGETVTHKLGLRRAAYLVAATGRLTVNGKPADTRDGVAALSEAALTITAEDDAEVVMVDVAA
jgi:redox-sensitive bicupin YhaK (pirin superfamily)